MLLLEAKTLIVSIKNQMKKIFVGKLHLLLDVYKKNDGDFQFSQDKLVNFLFSQVKFNVSNLTKKIM